MEGELVTVESTELPMNLQQVRARVNLIQEVMRSVMKDGTHYGTVPGCGDKPALLKAGAETLAMTFRLCPEYQVEIIDLGDGHREVRVRCRMLSATGAFLGEGVGSCSTMESKYRYRKAEQKCPECGKNTIIKGKKEYGGGWLCFRNKGGCGAKWGDGAEEIEGQEAGKVENEDIYSLVNTVLKMAKKRAMVDAALSAGSLSDTFTQDMEDLADNAAAAAKEAPESPAQPPPATRPAQTPPAAQTAPKPGANPERLALFETLKQAREALGWSQAEFLAYAQNNYRIQRVAEMTDEQIKEATAYMRGEQAADQGNDGQPEQPTMPGVAAGREHN